MSQYPNPLAMSNRSRLHAEDAEKIEQAIAFVNQQKNEEDDDSDYDQKDFVDAEVEEAEDRIYSEYKRAQADGAVMDE